MVVDVVVGLLDGEVERRWSKVVKAIVEGRDRVRDWFWMRDGGLCCQRRGSIEPNKKIEQERRMVRDWKSELADILL